MALESFPLKLEAEIVARIKADAEQLRIPATRHARQLIHSALEHDTGEEFDKLKHKLFTLEAKLDRLTELSIDGLAALLRSLATDEEGKRYSHTKEQAHAFIARLRNPER